MFGSFGAPEIIIIALVVILLFGVGKISGLGKELGSSIKEFRRAVKEPDDEKEANQLNTQAQQPYVQQGPPPQYAQTQQQYAQPQQQYAPPPPQPQYTPPPAQYAAPAPPPPPAQPTQRDDRSIF